MVATGDFTYMQTINRKQNLVCFLALGSAVDLVDRLTWPEVAAPPFA